MTNELFRRESLEAKRSSWLGGLSLAQPLRLWLLTGFMTLVAVLLIGFLAIGSYSRRSQVTGQLVPDLGLTTLIAPSSGVANRIFRSEGDVVNAGTPLVQIEAPRTLSDGKDMLTSIRLGMDSRDESVTAIGRSQIAQIDAQVSGTRGQLAIARQELHQVEQATATRRQQVRLARETAEKYRRIAGQKFISQVQVDQQEQALLAQVNEQQALERQATAVRRDIARMEQTLRELPELRTAQAATTNRDLAVIRQERVQLEANDGLLVKAPVAGLVASRLIEPGQAVRMGQPLLSLLPEGSRLEAQLLVPSRAIGFVAPGNTVLLRYQAYPYQKFGQHVGRITRISSNAINPGQPSELPGGLQPAEPFFRVLVELEAQTITAYGRREPLRPGMLLEADVLSERRKLYEWLLEPLYSLHGKVGAGSN